MQICIVTNCHISGNPRVVKEADALTEAGHDVSVITINNHPILWKEDKRMMVSRKWRLITFNYRRGSGTQESFQWLWTGCRKKFFEKILSRITLNHGIAERAHGREYDELTNLACRYPADLYIAHHAQVLGAAYCAARKHHAGFAFDAEDFHTGELPKGVNPHIAARIEYLEKKYLPYCNYITAASRGIADALFEKYLNIPKPEVILNLFPLEKLPDYSFQNRERVSIYWYSQVIGPGRGLEEAVLALDKLKKPCSIHLRGMLIDNFEEELKRLAGSFSGSLFFHPLAPAEQMVQLSAEHDIGLALETGESLNRLLCVTNKLFVYMLAGLAIVATDTPGQKEIMDQVPETGIMCNMADVETLASAINELISNPVKLANAKIASRKASEKQFNWDIEKRKLVGIVEQTIRITKMSDSRRSGVQK